MPSRAERSRLIRARVLAEWTLRASSVTLLALLLWHALHPAQHRREAIGGVSARSANLAAGLPVWTRRDPTRIRVVLDTVPPPAERDWLAALRRSGTVISWSTNSIPATAVAIERVADPVPSWQVSVVAPSGQQVILRDSLGVLDTARADAIGVRASLPSIAGRIGATVDGTTAWGVASDSVTLRRLLVEGMASWETKFVVAALQERGWVVDALVHVAPGVDVRQGSPSSPDTARYAAAIAVDSSATLIARASAAYVRSGGGLVAMRDAASLGPAQVGSPVVLERRTDGVIRAYRAGAGRILRIGYGDVWRGRMAGADSSADPVVINRAWWARVIASVAYAPRDTLETTHEPDPAPLASLVDRLGPQATASALVSLGAGSSRISDLALFALLIACLLLEWGSRRLRGAR